MRNVLLGIFLMVSIGLQSHPIIYDEVANALKEGNSEALASYFGKSVDLTIPDNEGVFSKAQAELILKTFFSKNKPYDFKVAHNGNSNNDAHYAIGNLNTSNGVFRTYILYKKRGDTITVLELRIESDE